MDKMDKIKTVVRFAVGGLVELFIGAITQTVVDHVDGPKVAKIGAKAGGFLVGMMIGDHVSEYICDSIEDTMGELEELKEAIDKEEEE